MPDRWLLAVEETLSLQDQVALYGHALGHLLLNREQEKMGRLPDPDPRAGYSHIDMLVELRMLETVRQPLDRQGAGSVSAADRTTRSGGGIACCS